jgi:hypothetical protein
MNLAVFAAFNGSIPAIAAFRGSCLASGSLRIVNSAELRVLFSAQCAERSVLLRLIAVGSFHSQPLFEFAETAAESLNATLRATDGAQREQNPYS